MNDNPNKKPGDPETDQKGIISNIEKNDTDVDQEIVEICESFGENS